MSYRSHSQITKSRGRKCKVCSFESGNRNAKPHEMTCAIPGDRLDEVVAVIKKAAEIDGAVAKYAASDSRRIAV